MKIKKFTFLLLAFSMLLIGCACGEYHDPIKNPSSGTETDLSSESLPKEDESSEETTSSDVQNREFTASIIFNGVPYVPTTSMQVQWSDGFNFKRADVDENGTARVIGLDGDYRVTLIGIPEGYSYNCNIYRATNDSPHVTISLYQIIPTLGSGRDLYQNIIRITKTGLYRAQLSNAKQIIYYEFKPTKAGIYTIESYVDVADNRFNPLMDLYNGTSAGKYFSKTINGGGESATYTANFKHTIRIDEQHIGNILAIGVHMDSMDGVYPANLDFTIRYEGNFSQEYPEATIMVPQENLSQFRDFDKSYTFVGAEKTVGTTLIFDSTRFKLNPDDGYYYLCDQAGNFTDTVLCAKITQACRFLELPFTRIEYVGNKALTVSNGTENYKLFIEGAARMADNELGMPIIYPGHENTKGYADFCNSDGVYPVTEELKEFLQKYSVSQRLFMDGQGWVETFSDRPVYAAEDDQWLFACGYYIKRA